MSSIPQNYYEEKALVDCVQRFFSKHHIGKLLAKCNGTKEKGVSPVSLMRYKLSKIFVGRSNSLSYDALTAHVAIVFTRYMLLATEQRQNEDQRTLGELFFFLVDEMADITFQRSISILWDALLASLQELLKLSDEQLMTFTADFMSRLPEYLRNALHPQTVMA